jgi:hypothetical protein
MKRSTAVLRSKSAHDPPISNLLTDLTNHRLPANCHGAGALVEQCLLRSAEVKVYWELESLPLTEETTVMIFREVDWRELEFNPDGPQAALHDEALRCARVRLSGHNSGSCRAQLAS